MRVYSAVFFGMFTASLTVNHVALILMNTTTVERLGIESMRQKERALLDSAFAFWDMRCVRLLRDGEGNC
jgi:hypothetical protein